MRYVSISYYYSPEFDLPESWLKRIVAYAGVLESLARENEIISIKQINYEGQVTHKGVHHHFVNLNRVKTHFPFKVNRYIKSLDPDVIIIQGLDKPLQLILLRAILPKKVKIIAHHHAEKPWIGLKKLVQLLADKFVDAYLFASHDLGMQWIRNGNLSSAEKIHEVMEVSSNFYPIDKKEARQKTGVNGEKVFLWVGRLNDNKDPLNVLRAFIKYAEKNAGVRLYMIYHTTELLEAVKQLIENHNAHDKVTLVGQVPHDNLLYWFNSADFILSGSHYEGSGTAVCEAMSCGCIPVVTDIPSFRMITGNGKCGLLYRLGNALDLFNALNQTEHLDIEERRQLCLNHFRENLSFQAIGNRIARIAQSI